MSKDKIDIVLSDDEKEEEVSRVESDNDEVDQEDTINFNKKLIKEEVRNEHSSSKPKHEKVSQIEVLNNKIESIADMIKNNVTSRRRKYRELSEEEKEFRRQTLVKARKAKAERARQRLKEKEVDFVDDEDYDQQEKKKHIIEKDNKPEPEFRPISMTDVPPPKKKFMMPIYRH